MGSRLILSCASFLPVLNLLRLSILHLGLGMGQTDRTAINALRPTLFRRGHIKFTNIGVKCQQWSQAATLIVTRY